jgi:hypothetical protein
MMLMESVFKKKMFEDRPTSFFNCGALPTRTAAYFEHILNRRRPLRCLAAALSFCVDYRCWFG